MCARGRDWLESVALLLSMSEHDRVDVMALGQNKYDVIKIECERDFEKTGEPSRQWCCSYYKRKRERRRETE